jgi:TRAP-type C4-dicarboxylate transport system permease small subunit
MMWITARRAVDRVLEFSLILIMTVNVLNVLWQVFTRFVLKDPSSFTEELARYLLIWLGLLGAGYVSGKKLHLAISVVLESRRGRSRRLMEAGIQVFILLFSFLVMVVGGIRLVAITFALNQVSAALRIQLGYVYLVLPVSGLLIMFYALVELVKVLRGAGED